MIIEITVDGITREFQGEYHELHNRDWNKRVRDMLDTVNEVEEEPVEEMPLMKGTRDNLEDIKIR